jgi:hypothetical protein
MQPAPSLPVIHYNEKDACAPKVQVVCLREGKQWNVLQRHAGIRKVRHPATLTVSIPFQFRYSFKNVG